MSREINFYVNHNCIKSIDITDEFDDSNLESKRISRIEPCNFLLRVLFYFMRFCFGDKSKAAERTRNWKCKWRVRFFNEHPYGCFDSHNEAVQDEKKVYNDRWK